MAFGVCNITKDLTGQVIIITGANTGLGKETARALARMGATIVLACRDTTKGIAVLNEIEKETNNHQLEVLKLDLSDLKSIKDFTVEFKSKYTRLDILINNAGVMAIPARQTTKDGFEMQFGTNHLGHFYLTNLLLDIIRRSAPSRIITLSSALHTAGKMKWDDLMMEKNYQMIGAYNQSKLANNLFTKELQRRVENDNVKVVSVHPGVIMTDLVRHMKTTCFDRFFVKCAYSISRCFWKTPVQGVQTTLQCALEDHQKLVGGGYYADCKIGKASKLSNDEKNWSRLWEVSDKLVAEKTNSFSK